MLFNPPTIQKLIVKETENMLKYVSTPNEKNLSKLENSVFNSVSEQCEKSYPIIATVV
jgi:hypothetical protein